MRSLTVTLRALAQLTKQQPNGKSIIGKRGERAETESAPSAEAEPDTGDAHRVFRLI